VGLGPGRDRNEAGVFAVCVDMMVNASRRALLGVAILVPAVALAGCATSLGSFTPEEGVRRLLTLSSERAFARLLRPGGFYDDALVRIAPPPQTSGAAGSNSGVLAAILNTRAVRDRVAIALNDVAVDAADRAAPVVTDSIRTLTVTDALALVRGGPTAATDLLQQRAGRRVLDALVPGVTSGLDSDLAEIASAAVAARTGTDYRVLGQFVADQAAAGIFRAIGREEQAIRADPLATRDPAIIALLAPGRLTSR